MKFEEAKEYAKVRAIEEHTRIALWSHINRTTGELVFTVSDDRIDRGAMHGCRHQGSVSSTGVYSS